MCYSWEGGAEYFECKRPGLFEGRLEGDEGGWGEGRLGGGVLQKKGSVGDLQPEASANAAACTVRVHLPGQWCWELRLGYLHVSRSRAATIIMAGNECIDLGFHRATCFCDLLARLP